MSSDLAARLESVVKRLEGVADRLSSSGGGGASVSHATSNGTTASAPSSPSGTSNKLTAYDTYHTTYVTPFITAAKSLPALKSVAQYATIAFEQQRAVIQATTQCKKPTDQELLSFVDPLVQVMQLSGKTDNKSPVYNQTQAWAEAVNAFGWIMQPTPASFITDSLEAADFYLVKTLTAAKQANDTASTQYAVALKQLLQQLIQFVKQNYPAGLEWQNSSGTTLSSFKPSASGSSSSAAPQAPSAPAPPSAPPAPAAPPSAPSAPGAPSFAPSSAAPASTSNAGMGAVFGELEASGGKFKFNKVTDDMKSKNMKDVAPLEVKAAPKPAAVAAKPATAAPAKPPSKNLVKGTWWVENFTGGQTVTVDGVQLKENVFISNCNNVTVLISDKTKSITVNGSKRVNVQFKSVVSIFEVVNCSNIKIECVETVPSVQIDKSNGIQIWLSRAGVAVIPQLITSNVSELNLVVPGATDDDDPIELPLPEQYISKYVEGRIVTEAVSHSGTG